MTGIRYQRWDVFTDRPLTGNPLGAYLAKYVHGVVPASRRLVNHQGVGMGRP